MALTGATGAHRFRAAPNLHVQQPPSVRIQEPLFIAHTAEWSKANLVYFKVVGNGVVFLRQQHQSHTAELVVKLTTCGSSATTL